MSGNRECWANGISPCGGGLSREHPVSKGLLGKVVTIRGLSWCEHEFKTVGVGSLTTKCLCRDHNSNLSPTDVEAQRYARIVRWTMDQDFRPHDGPDHIEELNGFLFARWMAKTACDVLASEKKYIPPKLAEYAFADSDDDEIRVYLVAAPGDAMSPNDDHIGLHWIHERDNPDGMLVTFAFRGYPWVIGTIDIDGAEELVREELRMDVPSSDGFVLRPRGIELQVPVQGLGMATKGQLRITW